ncbi:MAG TPA: hypothetical protein VNO17_03335 [Actinomycetota bacterium]|nr:hypothetical protein [Actinomycetota bacterium]
MTTGPDRYIVAAWAGSHLLVSREREGELPDLMVFDGPGESRILAPGAVLVAVSPDGSDVLVAGPGIASLIDVETGKTVASLDLGQPDPVTGQPIGYLAYAGSWVGDRVVAEGGPGMVVLSVTGSALRVTDAIALPRDVFPMPPHEPRLTPDGSRVVAWVPLPGPESKPRYAYLDCAISAHTCVQGPTTDVSAFYAVYNPSRPLPG